MIQHHLATLANGLRVVTVPMPHLHCIELVCYVGVGSRHETPATAGVSHFLEHMLFRGTAALPTSLDVERAFESIGGAVNAATDAESTCYHSRLRPESLERGAELFAELLLRPRWRDLETERKIILEEALEDLSESGELINPDILTNQLFWPGHPLSQPIIGSDESLRRLDLEALRQHHRRYYTPANTVIAVTGRVTPEAARAAVERAFGHWQGELPAAPVTAPEPTGSKPELVWVRDSSSQLTVQLAWQVPGRTSPHALPLRVWRRILSWGGTSRLMLQLREKLGLTYNVEANLALYSDCGCLTVDLAVHPDNLVESIREVLAIVSGMRNEPVGAEELEQVRRNIHFDLDYSFDHTDEMSVRYGWGELLGCCRSIEQDRRETDAIDAAQLQRTARELLLPARLRAAVVGPWRDQERRQVEALIHGWQG